MFCEECWLAWAMTSTALALAIHKEWTCCISILEIGSLGGASTLPTSSMRLVKLRRFSLAWGEPLITAILAASAAARA